MRKVLTAVVLSGALAMVPAFAFAQATPSKGKGGEKPAAAATAKPASHSTSGTVKSVDASSLVITKSGKKPEDMTFALNASTQKMGTIEPGAHVTVRYTTEGTTNTATAVTAKAGAAKKKDESASKKK